MKDMYFITLLSVTDHPPLRGIRAPTGHISSYFRVSSFQFFFLTFLVFLSFIFKQKLFFLDPDMCLIFCIIIRLVSLWLLCWSKTNITMVSSILVNALSFLMYIYFGYLIFPFPQKNKILKLFVMRWTFNEL